MLKLRSRRASGDLGGYLDVHTQREIEGNHLEKFDVTELLDLQEAA